MSYVELRPFLSGRRFALPWLGPVRSGPTRDEQLKERT